MRKYFLILAAALMFCGGAVGQAAPAKPAPEVAIGLTKEQRQKNVESFETAWKTVRDAHYDPTLGGVDWQRVHDELRPSIEKAESMEEARKVMQEMLGRLGHSHVGIIPSEFYTEPPGQQAEPGFDVRIVDGEAVVVRVSPVLPAAKAGVKPGWRIRKIDGEDLAPSLARIQKAVKKAPDALFAQTRMIQWRLRGEEGKDIAVTFLNDSGKETTLSISRAQPLGNLVQQVGLTPLRVHFEARKLDNDIVYFALSDFLDPVRVMPAFGNTVKKNLKSEGFIIDLRGNGGGLPEMAQGMGGWFIDQPNMKLGTSIFRTTKIHSRLNPREAYYDGPVAILVDELSGSTSEIFAGGMQDIKRARIFGTRTAGACLPSLFVKLPNGDRMQYVVADYVSASGKRLEGNGVEPDEVVPVDPQALLDGRDPAMDAAVKWIRSQRGDTAQK